MSRIGIIEGFVHRINKLGVISYIKLGKKDVEKFVQLLHLVF